MQPARVVLGRQQNIVNCAAVISASLNTLKQEPMQQGRYVCAEVQACNYLADARFGVPDNADSCHTSRAALAIAKQLYKLLILLTYSNYTLSTGD